MNEEAEGTGLEFGQTKQLYTVRGVVKCLRIFIGYSSQCITLYGSQNNPIR